MSTSVKIILRMKEKKIPHERSLFAYKKYFQFFFSFFFHSAHTIALNEANAHKKMCIFFCSIQFLHHQINIHTNHFEWKFYFILFFSSSFDMPRMKFSPKISANVYLIICFFFLMVVTIWCSHGGKCRFSLWISSFVNFLKSSFICLLFIYLFFILILLFL